MLVCFIYVWFVFVVIELVWPEMVRHMLYVS
jgi:hypothetical protein